MKEKNLKEFNGSKSAIAFYIIAVIFLLYGAFTIYTTYDYLVSYYQSAGESMGSQFSTNLQYFVSNCASYFVYAILCYGIGMILQKLKLVFPKVETNNIEEVIIDEV